MEFKINIGWTTVYRVTEERLEASVEAVYLNLMKLCNVLKVSFTNFKIQIKLPHLSIPFKKQQFMNKLKNDYLVTFEDNKLSISNKDWKIAINLFSVPAIDIS